MRMKKTAVTTAVAGALPAGAAGVGTGLATAGMTPPPGPTVTALPAWAPPKPAEPAWSMGIPGLDAGWNHWASG